MSHALDPFRAVEIDSNRVIDLRGPEIYEEGDGQPFVVSEALTEDRLKEAKKLHASVFTSRGYVAPTDLVESGDAISTEEDPYQTHAQYFVAERVQGSHKTVAAAARFIYAEEGTGLRSFQTYLKQEIQPAARLLIESVDPSEIVEVSGLVKSQGESSLAIMVLYRELWRISLLRGYRYWIMSCDQRLLRKLQATFGSMVAPIGDANYFKGHTVVPTMMDVQSAAETFRAEMSHCSPLLAKRRAATINFLMAPAEVSAASSTGPRVSDSLVIDLESIASEEVSEPA